MGELVGSVIQFLDTNSNIVSRMALVFNVKSQTLNFLDNVLELLIVVPYENAIVYVDHKNDVVTEEYTVINLRWMETNGLQFLN